MINESIYVNNFNSKVKVSIKYQIIKFNFRKIKIRLFLKLKRFKQLNILTVLLNLQQPKSM